MPTVRSLVPGRPGRLLRDGYEFLSRECDRAAANIAQFRLLGVPVTVLRGAEAAKVFYSDRLQRHGANPGLLQKTLVGRGTVQGLDGPAHHRRKAMFLSILAAEKAEGIAEEFARQWHHRAPSWEQQSRILLFDEVGEMLCAAACRWAGIPLPERDVRRRTLQLRALIEGPGSVGRRYWRGRIARSRTERWLAGLVEQQRMHAQSIPGQGSPLHTIATYRDVDGRVLDPRTAAAEVLNVIRPIVAIDRFIVFAALALHEHPQWRGRLSAGDDGDVEPFVQEVRRFYPFFPAVVAKARESFSWQGHEVPAGQRVILDLYGTDHLDVDLGGNWQAPDSFDPSRFSDREPDPFGFIPQGGGDFATGHRCAGEWAVLAVLRTAVRLLAGNITYEVPDQNLAVRLNRAPAIPESRFVITKVRTVPNDSDRREQRPGALGTASQADAPMTTHR